MYWANKDRTLVYINNDLVESSSLSSAELAKVKDERERDDVKTGKAIDYLKETSWIIERKYETGKDVPSEVSEARARARVILDNHSIIPDADF